MRYFVAIKSKDNLDAALETARRYSPNIEIVDEETLVFDLSGSKTKQAPQIAQELENEFGSVAVSDNLAAALLIVRHRKDSGLRIQDSEKKNQNFPKPTFEESTKTKYSAFASPAPIENGKEFNERPFGARKKAEAKRSTKFQVSGSKKQSSKTANLVTGAQAPSPAVSEAKEPTKNEERKTKDIKKPQDRNLNSTWDLNILPLTSISQNLEFLELMDSWAVHDLRTFCQLPEDEMVERFGPEMVGLRRLAAGESFRSPNWNVKDDKFYWEKELDGSIETLEPLNFIISKGVMQVFRNLDYVGLSTQSVKITLRGRKKKKIYRIRLVFPTKNKKIWIRQIITKIELETPPFNIDHVALEFRSTKPRTIQNNLYSGSLMQPENLNMIVSKLKKVVGVKKIGVPRLRDDWRRRFYMTEDLGPLIAEGSKKEYRIQDSGFREDAHSASSKLQDASSKDEISDNENVKTGGQAPSPAVREAKKPTKNEKRKTKDTRLEATKNSKLETRNRKPKSKKLISPKAYYYFPKPLQARVFFEAGEPRAVLINGKREMVKQSGGPWRKDAEWYQPGGWRRDEWDIETESGSIYKVYVDKDGDAFVEGGYD